MKKIILILLITLFNLPAYSETIEKTAFFDITNLTETFLKAEINKISSSMAEDKTKVFNDAVMKFNQGNVSASYDDFSKLIDMTKTDFGLLNLAKTLYTTGFFSLGENALNRIEQKTEMAKLTNDLKLSASAKYLSKDDEIYLGKALSSILYDNSAAETIFDLNKHEDILAKSDRANYVMSLAYVQMKQYKQALFSINEAISINQNNNLYILLKLKILTLQEDYKTALKYSEKIEKSNLIKIAFLSDFEIQKKNILLNTAKNEEEKLFYKAEIAILKDDTYGAKKILEEILAADKTNLKALNLLGFCNLKLNDINSAEENFKSSYEIKKNSSFALSGMGDIEFINYRYKNALNYYQKAYKKDEHNSVLINKIILASIFSQEPETAVKMTKIYSKETDSHFYDFYNIGTTTSKFVLRDKVSLSDEYIKKAISLNPFWNISWLEFAKRELDKGQLSLTQNILEAVYLSRDIGYNYYYTSALVDIYKKQENSAIKNLENAIELNPEFEPAVRLKSILNSVL